MDTNITIERIDVTKIEQVNSLSVFHISLINGKPTPNQVLSVTTHNTNSGYATTIYNYTSKTGSLMVVEKKFPKQFIIKCDGTVIPITIRYILQGTAFLLLI